MSVVLITVEQLCEFGQYVLLAVGVVWPFTMGWILVLCAGEQLQHCVRPLLCPARQPGTSHGQNGGACEPSPCPQGAGLSPGISPTDEVAWAYGSPGNLLCHVMNEWLFSAMLRFLTHMYVLVHLASMIFKV